MNIIDAHSHLWLQQDTWVNGKRILSKQDGRSIFMDEEVQMLPPFMIEGKNTAEIFLSNMNYAQVGGAVVVQEIIDGNQNSYLQKVQEKYPNRFFCMGMANDLEEAQAVCQAGLKGIAFPGHRIQTPLTSFLPIFKMMESKHMVLSMCLGEDERQIGEMKEVIQECPDLKVAIGHFGMVTTPAFESQVRLVLEGRHVMIESGGITWLFHHEFYPYPSAVRSIKQAADWVGMDRLMWGEATILVRLRPSLIECLMILSKRRMNFLRKKRSCSWELMQKAFMDLKIFRFFPILRICRNK